MCHTTHTHILHVHHCKIYFKRTDAVSESLSGAAILADLDDDSLSAGVSASKHDNNFAALDAAIQTSHITQHITITHVSICRTNKSKELN